MHLRAVHAIAGYMLPCSYMQCGMEPYYLMSIMYKIDGANLLFHQTYCKTS